MIPIDVLIRPVTSEQIFEKALDMLEAVNIPARSWRQGGVARTLLSVGAELGFQGASIVTSCVRGFFLFFGQGDYLTAHAKDVYDVDRIPATFATGKVVLTNTAGGVFNELANTVIVRSSTTNARFRITVDFSLGALETSDPLDVVAIEAGSKSSVAPSEIDEFETPLERVTVTNPASIIGRDQESDEQLRTRCMKKKGTWSPFGPRDAYEYAALTALLPDGSPTTISRVKVSRFSSVGRVVVTCATPNGTPSADELDAVRAEVEKIARPEGVTVVVEGAVVHATAHSVILWAKGGSAALLESQAQAALAAYFADFPIGGQSKADGGPGFLFADAVGAVIINSSQEVFDVDFVGGAVDVPIASNEVAVNTTTLEVRIL